MYKIERLNDLVLVVTLSAISLLFIFTHWLNEILIIRMFLGFLLLLFLPGYSLISVIFVNKNDFDFIERIFLSFGISIAITPLLGLLLDYTEVGINLFSVTFSIFVVIISFCGIAHILRNFLGVKGFYISFDMFKLPKSIIDKLLFLLIILGMTLVFYLYVFHPGTTLGSLYGYGYFYMKNTILSTGHLPDIPVFGDKTLLHSSIEHHRAVDYLRPISMALLQLVCGTNMVKYPVTTVISFSSFFLVAYWLTKDSYISAIGSLALLLSPLLFFTQVMFNGMSLTISIILLLSLFMTRMIVDAGTSKNLLVMLILFPIILRFYHSLPFYVIGLSMASLASIMILHLCKNKININLGNLTYIFFLFLFSIYTTLQSSYYERLVGNNVSELHADKILSKLTNYLNTILRHEKPNLEIYDYLYAESLQFHIMGYIVLLMLVIFSIITIFYIFKKYNQYQKIVVILFIFILSFILNFLFLINFNLVGRSIIVFLNPTLLLFSTLCLYFQNIQKKNFIVVIIAFLMIFGQFVCGINGIYNAPSQTYVFYTDQQIYGCGIWPSDHIEGKILSDIKTINILGHYNKVDSEILMDASMETSEVSKMLKDWYYNIPSMHNILSKSDVSYIIFTNDILNSVYVGLNYHLKPIGHQRYEEWLSIDNKIYDNGNVSIIKIRG